jgi:hypothetical protein
MRGGGAYVSGTDDRYFIAHEVSFLDPQQLMGDSFSVETRLAASPAAETGQAPSLH